MGLEYDPWTHLASLPHITFGVHRLPAGRGWWLADIPGIVLDDRLTRVERRCTLAHELVHAERDDRHCHRDGGSPDAHRLGRRRERDTDQLVARRLIPLRRLADALRWGREAAEVADELDVTVDVLHTRMDHLHPAERAHLARALNREDTPA